MDNKIAHTKYGDIEYTLIGKGMPVLFVHGGHSNCFEKLAHKGFDHKEFQLITPSRPGYGKTPLNGHRTPGQAARLIAGLLEYLGMENVVVYGISAGGLTAIELAANYPDKVSKLVLASAISKKWLDKKGKTYKTAKIMFSPRVERITWGMVRLLCKIAPGVVAKSFHPQFSSNVTFGIREKDAWELVLALRHYRSGEGFVNDIDQDIGHSVITKIKCPTCIVHSKNDNSVPFEHALHSKKMIQNSTIIGLDNEWGHLFWMGCGSAGAISRTIEFIKS